MTELEQKDFVDTDKEFLKNYDETPSTHLLSYGRLEIIGNHTDHQHGHCLVSACSLGIKCSLSPQEGAVDIVSLGYGKIHMALRNFKPLPTEKGTSAGLVRGVLSYFYHNGYRIGGFKAVIKSDIFRGAGVSSSAAYELFVAEALNILYNEGKISRLTLAKAGQYAENVHFGKASGLLDQCGSSFGGIQYLDFGNIDDVKVEPVSFPAWPLHIVLVNPGASHSKLSDLYSEMPNDMKLVAKNGYGAAVLREVDPDRFYEKIMTLDVPERARRRALHYFGEDARVLRAKEAFETGNMDYFLELERESQLSQMALLENVMVKDNYEGSPLEAVNRACRFLKKGAARVMGGGLIGSIICFVPNAEFASFMRGMRGFYDPSNVVEVGIPEQGAHEVR